MMHLSWVREVRWELLQHAYGAASDVPEQLPLLVHDDEEVRDDAWDWFNGAICHQGSTYSASVAIVPFLVNMLREAPAPYLSSIVNGLQFITPFTDADLLTVRGSLDEPYWQRIYAADQVVPGFAEWVAAEHEALAFPEGRPVTQSRESYGAEKWAARVLGFEALRGAIPLLLGLLGHADAERRSAAAELLSGFRESGARVVAALQAQISVEPDAGTLCALLHLLSVVGRKTGWAAKFAETLFTERTEPGVHLAAANALIVLRGARVDPGVVEVVCVHQGYANSVRCGNRDVYAFEIPDYQGLQRHLAGKPSHTWVGKDTYLLRSWPLSCVSRAVAVFLGQAESCLRAKETSEIGSRVRTLLYWNERIWVEDPEGTSLLGWNLLQRMLPIILRWLAYPLPDRTGQKTGEGHVDGKSDEPELPAHHERVALAHLAVCLYWIDVVAQPLVVRDRGWLSEARAALVAVIAVQRFRYEPPWGLSEGLDLLKDDLRQFAETRFLAEAPTTEG
jgi:hypothetical protein